MQLIALNSEKKLVFARQAVKQHDYFCIECQQVVRLRSGPHRHAHYYHLSPLPSCRQSEKSMAHIQTQLRLLSLFPEGDVQLERRFPEINRIADVVWASQKFVFEVQCSSITAAEVQERNKDYESLGFQVIWILHEKRYNQWRFTAAEQWLRNRPHYFTNINAEGEGMIYDQYDIDEKGVRKHIQSKLEVNLEHPRKIMKDEKRRNLPRVVANRLENWTLHFSGDLLDLCLYQSAHLDIQELLENAFAAEKESTKFVESGWVEKTKKIFWYGVVRPYRLFFQMLLERACK